MSLFEWNDRLFGLQIPEMDLEHQMIMNMMNELYLKNEQRCPKNELLQTIQYLVQFVREHFKNEEIYLEKIKYPSLEPHKKVHARLLLELEHFQKEFETQEATVISARFFDFLELWVTAHIQYYDKDYSFYTHQPTTWTTLHSNL